MRICHVSWARLSDWPLYKERPRNENCWKYTISPGEYPLQTISNLADAGSKHLLKTNQNTYSCPVAWGFRIQPTFALVRVVRGDLSLDINCPIPPAHCMLGLLACSEAFGFGQFGTELSWFR